MLYDDITCLTCNFNHSYMTMRMIESLFMQLDTAIPVVIMDNSNKISINELCKKEFTVIDNFKNKLLNYIIYEHPSKNHCASIDYALKNCIKTKYVLLCDNDILFKRDIVNFIALRHDFDAVGQIDYTWIMPERLLPFCCIIDVEKFKNDNLNYFDQDRCILSLAEGFNYPVFIDGNLYQTICDKIFDTGASFYDDIRFIWNIKDIKLDEIIEHCISGSHDGKNNEIQTYDVKYKYKGINDFYKKNENLYNIKI